MINKNLECCLVHRFYLRFWLGEKIQEDGWTTGPASRVSKPPGDPRSLQEWPQEKTASAAQWRCKESEEGNFSLPAKCY